MKKSNLEFIHGVRLKNGSLKAYKCSDNNYELVFTRYFWGIKLSKRKITVSTYEEVEDYFAAMKFERRFPFKRIFE